MRLSIITATYNSYPAINDCLSCVMNQTLKSEHIIIDGGSKDLTLKTIGTSKSISKYISEPDNGIYDALNKGIKLASGDIIGLLHSDDLFASEDILEKVSQAFEKTKADILYGDLVYVDKNDTTKVIRYWKSQPFKMSLLKRGWMPAHPTVFARREVYEKHGLFDLDLKIAADYDLMLRIFQDRKLKFVYLPEVITRMRLGGASNKSLKNLIQKSKEDYLAIKKNKIGFAPLVLFLKNISKLPQFLKK